MSQEPQVSDFETLKEYQAAQAEFWKGVVLAPSNENREVVEENIAYLYERMGKAAPTQYRWCSSVGEAWVTAYAIFTQLHAQKLIRPWIINEIQNPIGDSHVSKDYMFGWECGRAHERLYAWANNGPNPHFDQIKERLIAKGEASEDPIDILVAQVVDQNDVSYFGKELTDATFEAATWCGDFGAYDTTVAEGGIPENAVEGYQALRALSLFGSDFWLFSDMVVISKKFITHECVVDQMADLHCADGPAIEWADGYKEWYWEGIRVNQLYIECPDSITVEDINAERNAELRRMMLERFGLSRFIEEGEFRTLDVDAVPVDKLDASSDTILRALLVSPIGERWLACTCPSTGRMFHLLVPEHVKTCSEAHQELSGIDENDIIAEG